MLPTLVLNVVGLTPSMIGEDTPHLNALAGSGALAALDTVTPAVTCSVQSTLLSGLPPSQHGVVANGWYFRDTNEVRFWLQSNRLVAGEKVWETARRQDPDFTCANLFWWYNMATTADIAVTPRPMYPADGRKIPDVHSQPSELRDQLDAQLGTFPLFKFWGPATGIESSRWIAESAHHVIQTRRPGLTLVYLPHLDYVLQRSGPDAPELGADLRAVDALCGSLIERAKADGMAVMVLSEYGVTAVDTPVHVNRALREAGLLAVRTELGRELLDPAASKAFAVSDHQIAHLYVADPRDRPRVASLVAALPGVERVLDDAGKAEFGLDHPRSGELVALAEPSAWFTYYYWLDDARCPDFARTVDIHRKPGYDPVELFLDPALPSAKARIAWRLLQKKLGFRALMDVIGLDATLVRGSHGRITEDPNAGPLVLSSEPDLLGSGPVEATGVKDLILSHLFR